MSSISQVIYENSEKFLPAFARIPAAGDGKSGRYSPLDFHFIGGHPQPAPDERELNRWMVLGGCMFTVTKDGTPIDVAAGATSGQPARLFYGGAEVLLTDQRLLTMVIKGETVVGTVGGSSGSVLVASFPLTRVESVHVDLKRGVFGGLNEKRLHIMCMSSTVADMWFDAIVAESGAGPRGYQSFRGTKRDILEALVGPTVAARRPGADPAEEQQLQAAERGIRHETPNEIGVAFVSD